MLREDFFFKDFVGFTLNDLVYYHVDICKSIKGKWKIFHDPITIIIRFIVRERNDIKGDGALYSFLLTDIGAHSI